VAIDPLSPNTSLHRCFGDFAQHGSSAANCTSGFHSSFWRGSETLNAGEFMKPGVVLDKNYLQGGSRNDVELLAKTHRLVMPGALFYELMTTSPEARCRCFSKLPDTENPVELVDHIGVLLRQEIPTGEPCGKPSLHGLKVRFRFNELLLQQDYRLPGWAQDTVDHQTINVEADVDQLINLSEQTADLFPGMLEGSTVLQRAARIQVEATIANVAEVHEFFGRLQSPDPASPYPDITGSPEHWAHIRWLQVHMLFATDLYARYGGNIRTKITQNVRTRIEHDVHDAQILTLAVLEGAFATKEKKLRRWWSLLHPSGEIFPKVA
jgi:hypothetical protein